MRMICRECKRIISIHELTGYAGGHFLKLLLSAGLATWLASAIKDYFSDKTRGFVDENMAGACNAFQMACPKCQKTSCWDPLPEIELEQQEEDKQITME